MRRASFGVRNVREPGTYHNVPSTSNTMPRSLGALCLFSMLGSKGANRLGFVVVDIVALNLRAAGAVVQDVIVLCWRSVFAWRSGIGCEAQHALERQMNSADNGVQLDRGWLNDWFALGLLLVHKNRESCFQTMRGIARYT